MERARHRYDQHTRWEHFKKHSNQWHAVRQHREFLAAALSAANQLDDAQRTALAAQLELASTILDELDTIQHPEVLIPNVPDPTPENLKPFLKDWSPYGPERR